ncbi:Aminodeoxychorismate lyase, partial [hydrothermal vent metagenome]
LAKRNKVKRGVARITLTRGRGARGYAVRKCDDPTSIITVKPYLPDEQKQKNGITVVPVTDIRKDPKSPFANVKSTSALDKIYAIESAKRNNADEALLMSVDGHLASLASANLFWVKGSALHTPSLDCGILAGVTRGSILKLASGSGLEVVEGQYAPDVLKEADEVFVTNSLIEIQTVKKVTGLFESVGNGAVTKKLLELYQNLILNRFV